MFSYLIPDTREQGKTQMQSHGRWIDRIDPRNSIFEMACQSWQRCGLLAIAGGAIAIALVYITTGQ